MFDAKTMGIIELLILAGIGVAGMVGIAILFIVVPAASGNSKPHDSR